MNLRILILLMTMLMMRVWGLEPVVPSESTNPFRPIQPIPVFDNPNVKKLPVGKCGYRCRRSTCQCQSPKICDGGVCKVMGFDPTDCRRNKSLCQKDQRCNWRGDCVDVNRPGERCGLKFCRPGLACYQGNCYTAPLPGDCDVCWGGQCAAVVCSLRDQDIVY